MFDDLYFLQPQYFECKQADIEYINNKVSKNFFPKISRPEEGGGEGLYIWFSYTRSIIRRRVIWDLKGYYMHYWTPYFFQFQFHITYFNKTSI